MSKTSSCHTDFFRRDALAGLIEETVKPVIVVAYRCLICANAINVSVLPRATAVWSAL